MDNCFIIAACSSQICCYTNAFISEKNTERKRCTTRHINWATL